MICPWCKEREAVKVTCGDPACVAANVRWIKRKWWHKHRGKRKVADAPAVVMDGTLPELDASESASVTGIPQVDNSDMPDTRTGQRVIM